jgi:hypothetical protein
MPANHTAAASRQFKTTKDDSSTWSSCFERLALTLALGCWGTTLRVMDYRINLLAKPGWRESRDQRDRINATTAM